MQHYIMFVWRFFLFICEIGQGFQGLASVEETALSIFMILHFTAAVFKVRGDFPGGHRSTRGGAIQE